ncbi:MAG: Sua5/YciO/YrdC/YwlC family protein, partial [Gammaproteobacteria bacterium]|nr:Sua5/YciO/YrdC/YwlC family protein [Gammaproteobacteria bacterium]
MPVETSDNLPDSRTMLRLAEAARTLHAGGIVAYPTEGVYGLGCLPTDLDAVERLLRVKRRSWRKGLPLIAA